MSTLRTINIKHESSSSNNISLDAGGGVTVNNGVTLGTGTTISSPASDTFIVSTNGSERLRVDSSGNINVDSGGVYYDATNNRLAVGTTSPGLPLDIVSDASSETVRFRGASGGTGTLRFTSNDGTTNYSFIQSRSTFLDIGTETSIPLIFSTSNNERLRITSDGKLGLGTSTVNADLHVYNSSGDAEIRITSNSSNQAILRFGNTVDQTLGSIRFDSPTDSFQFYGLNDTERLRITSDGKLGLGTSTPGSYSYNDLVVAGATGGMSIVTGTTGTGRLVFADGVAGVGAYRGAIQYDHANERLELAAEGSARAYLTSTGLGVGTTSPQVIFEASQSNGTRIRSTFTTTGGARDGGFEIYGDGDVKTKLTYAGNEGVTHLGYGIYGLAFDRGGSEVARIDGSGRLLVGTSSASSSEKLNVTYAPASTGVIINTNASFAGNSVLMEFKANGTTGGSIVFTNNGTSTAYVGSSDYRLKENVVALKNGITRLLQLKPRQFNFITDPNNIVDGFIAHEAQEVVPQAVTGSKDEVDNNGNPIYQGIDQSNLVPLLTAALQEAIGEIESLKARVAVLEA